MIDFKKILDYFNSVINSRDKRIDNYLSKLKNIEGVSDDFSNQIIAEIKNSRLTRNISYLFLLIFLLGFFLFLITSQNRKDNLKTLASINLPVYFENDTNGDLIVKYDSTNLPIEVSEEVLAMINNPNGFGRHPGLGKNKNLKIFRNRKSNSFMDFFVLPLNDNKDQVLGNLSVHKSTGAMDLKTPLLIGQCSQYENLPNFLLYLEKYDSPTKQWFVKFGEIVKNDTIFQQDVYTIHVGSCYTKSIIASNPLWKNLYFISISMGPYGENKELYTGQVWIIKSEVIKLSFG